MNRAENTLIFVPGTGYGASNSAESAAMSIAAAVDPGRKRVEVKTETPAATRGLRAASTIVVDAHRVLDVVELDYREKMATLDQDDSNGQAIPPNLFQMAWYTAWGFWRVVVALGKRSKGAAARAHLFIGAFFVALLVLAFALTVLSVVALLLAGIVDQKSWPSWIARPEEGLILLGGLVSGAAYLAFRAKILRAAEALRQWMRYIDEPSDASTVSRRLTAAIDGLIDDGYGGRIHILAYSGGGLIVLDELAPRHGLPVTAIERVTSRISSLVTVGCPYDFVQAYFPRFFKDKRQSVRSDLTWHNIFIASDIFGSNFRKRDDDEPGDATGPCEMPLTSHRYLPTERLRWYGFIKQAGLRQHNKYWDDEGGCWTFVTHLWNLPPL